MDKSKSPISFRMVKAWEKERTDWGSRCAKKIRKELEQLSKCKLKLEPMGAFVESGYNPNFHGISTHLDYWVFSENSHIATIEPSCPNYTFEGSQIMPVNFYKGEIIKQSEVPVFIVYNMTKERRTLKDRCVWIRGEDVIKSPNDWRFLGGKNQHNYITDKNDWHRGLQTLIDELLKIAKLGA